MTRFALTALGALLVLPAVAAETLGLKTDTDRINYSLGFQIGGDFKRPGARGPAAHGWDRAARAGGERRLSGGSGPGERGRKEDTGQDDSWH